MNFLGRNIALLFVSVLMFGGCRKGDVSTPGIIWEKSGIEGKVWIGPVTPVCSDSLPCYEAYQATILLYDNSGRFVKMIQSDAEGNFQEELPPGTYRLVPVQPNQNNFPTADQQIVLVAQGRFTWVEIFYDTGIR